MRLPDSAVVLGVLRQIEKHSVVSLGGFFSTETLHTLRAFHLLQTDNDVAFRLSAMAETIVGSAPMVRTPAPTATQLQAAISHLHEQAQRLAPGRLAREHARACLDMFTWRSMYDPPSPGQWCLVRLHQGGDALDCYIGDLEGFPLEWREGPEGYGRYNVVTAWRPHVELPVP